MYSNIGEVASIFLTALLGLLGPGHERILPRVELGSLSGALGKLAPTASRTRTFPATHCGRGPSDSKPGSHSSSHECQCSSFAPTTRRS